MTFENYFKATENLETLVAEISAVKEKNYELETEESVILAVSGDSNLEKDKNNLQFWEAALKIASCDEMKSSIDKEVETIRARIKGLERLALIASEKEENNKKLKQLLKKYDAAYKKFVLANKAYVEERAKFSDEISGKVIANEEKEPETVPEVEEVVEETASRTSYPDEIVPVVETKNVEEKTKENAVHPVQALCAATKYFQDVYSYNSDSENFDSYSIAYASLWNEIKLPKTVIDGISKICSEEEISGMTASQVKKLKLSLPKELLICIKREDVIAERSPQTQFYKEGGLNSVWRSKFTYNVMSQLWELVQKNISAVDEDTRSENEVCIDEFMYANTDHKKISGIFKLEKPVWEAFAIVEA